MISHLLSVKGENPISGPDTLLARLPLWRDPDGLPQNVFKINYAPDKDRHALLLFGPMLRIPVLIHPDTDLIIRLETVK